MNKWWCLCPKTINALMTHKCVKRNT